MSKVRKALIVATLGVAGAIAVPAAAQAGIYTWKYEATFGTLAACQAAGPAAAAADDADTWRCTSTSEGVKLYLGYVW